MYVLITTLWCNKDGEFSLPSKAPLCEVARLRSTARRLRRRIASHRLASHGTTIAPFADLAATDIHAARARSTRAPPYSTEPTACTLGGRALGGVDAAALSANPSDKG